MFSKPVCALIACLALTSCDDDAPAGRPTAQADAMWKLAPEGTQRAIVVSPYGLAQLEKGFTSLRDYIAKAGPELVPIAGLLDTLLEKVGGKDFSLANLQLSSTKGAALFQTDDGGQVAILPIADRAAFLAQVKGTPAATPDGIDSIDNARCKMFGALYTCASSEAVLGAIGKSAIRDRFAIVKSRGDIELVISGIPLQGPSMPRSSLAAAVELEGGQWLVRGVIGKAPESMTGKLKTLSKPRTSPGTSAGFLMFDIRTLVEPTPDVVVDGITQADLVNSVAGPLTLDVPAGTSVFDIQVPLSNPAPLTKVVEKCGEIGPLAAVAKSANGVCTLDLTQLLNTKLDMWVDGNTLHLGKKTGAPVPAQVSMSKAARELANGTWGLAFWGRGSMFSPTGKEQADAPQIPPGAAAQIRALATLDEIGFGAKLEGENVRFVVGMRTTFAEAKPIVDALAQITASDVISNRADKKAKRIVDANPSSQFAQDFAAGQHGITIPAQLTGSAVEGLLPALVSQFRREKEPEIAQPEGPKPGEITAQRVAGYATHAYGAWKEKNPGKACPASMDELGKAVSAEAATDDEWGRKLVLKCGKDIPADVKGQPIVIESWGFDGKPGTADDISSSKMLGTMEAPDQTPPAPTAPPAPTPAPAPGSAAAGSAAP